HDQKVDTVLLADIVEHADIRMIERRNGLCFAFEACFHFGVVAPVRRQNFDSDRAIQAGVRCFLHPAHTPLAERRNDLVRTKSHAWNQRLHLTAFPSAAVQCWTTVKPLLMGANVTPAGGDPVPPGGLKVVGVPGTAPVPPPAALTFAGTIRRK